MTKLTTHVLDIYSGKPGAGIKVDLYFIKNNERKKIASTKLNEDYKKKFNFPFIMAVTSFNKKQILDSFRYRIKKNINEEFNEAKIQVKKIGNIRLEQILNKNL